MELTGKHAVVTGGGTGIGLAIAQELQAQGSKVTIGGRRADVLEATAATHGFEFAVVDVTDGRSVANFAEAVGDVDILVNNAGLMHQIRVDDENAVAIASKEFDTNVIGCMRIVQAFLPGLKTRRGAIVNVTSGLAYVPWPAAPSYCATKAALHSWTHSLRSQLTEVSVFEVLPPLTDTTMVTDVDIGMKKATPEEVAKALVRGMQRDQYEIPVGMSKSLALMRRVAPDFIRKQLAKAS